jgi:hypothetical protein
MHSDLETIPQRMPAIAAVVHIIEQRYVVLPSIPEDERHTLDDYKRLAEEFNQIGASAVAEGIRFAYQNHGYGVRNPTAKAGGLDR